MKVLLTGATGFIGSHVARLLVANGVQVTAIIKSSTERSRIADVVDAIRIIPCDVGNREFLEPRLREDLPDVCIHLAWHGWSGPSLTADDNLVSMAASLELVRTLISVGCPRFVGVGTCFEYDPAFSPMSETSPVKPTDLYGVCKHELSAVAQALRAITSMSVAWARVFLVYGPFDDERRLVPSLVRSLLRGEPARMTRGEQVRDVVHVEDAASAIWMIARSSHVGPVNVASGVPVRVVDIAQSIAAIIGRADLLELGALPYRALEPPVLVADTTLLRHTIGWSQQFDLEAGLTQTVEWWRAYERNHRC